MGTPIQPSAVKLLISDDLTGSVTWNALLNMDSHSRDGQPAGTNQRFVFGQTAPYTTTTGVVDNYSWSGLYDPADTTGQELFRTAARATPTQNLTVAVLHDATTSAEAGYYQIITPTGEGESVEREGEFYEVSLTAVGAGPKTSFSGGLPSTLP